jgi:hypothetical protein
LSVGIQACDPLAGPSYLGEPLITVAGKVANDLPTSPPPGEIALVFLYDHSTTPAGPTYRVEGESVPASPRFPSQFDFEVYHPPPPEVLLPAYSTGEAGEEVGEARYTAGYIFALEEGTAARLDGAQPSDVLGVCNSHLLIYFDSEVAAESEAGATWGGAYSAGYHLVDRGVPSDDELEVFGACVEAAAREQEAAIRAEMDCLTACPELSDGVPEPSCEQECTEAGIPDWPRCEEMLDGLGPREVDTRRAEIELRLLTDPPITDLWPLFPAEQLAHAQAQMKELLAQQEALAECQRGCVEDRDGDFAFCMVECDTQNGP